MRILVCRHIVRLLIALVITCLNTVAFLKTIGVRIHNSLITEVPILHKQNKYITILILQWMGAFLHLKIWGSNTCNKSVTYFKKKDFFQKLHLVTIVCLFRIHDNKKV